MNKEKYQFFEWTIKNFSCWNSELHGNGISSTPSNTKVSLQLYPRGLNGIDERLFARLCCIGPCSFFGEVSFIGSDGSLLCTRQVGSNEKLDALEFPPGPEFKDVVTKIRKNLALHEDKLTLRWRVSVSSANERVQYMCTTINAFDFVYKISSKILCKLCSTPTPISCLDYPLDDEKMATVFLNFSENESDRSKIVLTLLSNDKIISVFTRMSVLNDEDVVVRNEDNEHLFRGSESWDFCNSLTRAEVETFSFTLHLKIIPKRQYKHCSGSRLPFLESVLVMPTSVSKPPGASISGEGSSSSTATDTSNESENSVSVLTNELMCLYQDQDFSDFQLKCDGVSVPVHKNILSARSPVFKTMLSCDMQEAASQEVVIEDLDPSTLTLFLTYLYTGAVEDLQNDRALKLYYAADKYQVPSLKRECVEFLCSNVSISNVCDILSLADKHQDEKLISVTHGFMLRNYSEVLSSAEWKDFMRSEPLVALETLTLLGEQRGHP